MATHVCVLTSVHQPFDGRIFHRECKTLAQAGYQVTLVAPADFGHQEQDGITVLGVPRPDMRLYRPLTWYRLYRIVRRLRPDIIHFHDPELLLLVPLFRATLDRDTKLVYDVHEYFADAVAGKFWIPSPLRQLAAGLSGWLEQKLASQVDGIVCAVEGQEPLYVDKLVPLVVIRNLPIARVFEDATPHPDLDVGGCKLIYVGLILRERGIDVLLEAVRILARQGRDVNLFLIGRETSGAYMKEVQTFVQANQLTGRIHWVGYVPHDQIKRYLANADIGVAPGLRTRQYSNPGISTKLFEYMICGLPIVSVDHPHRKRYIDECKCGLTVAPEDPSEHARAIAWLIDHPEEAETMALRGQEMVLERYTWEQEQPRLLAFYRDVLASPGRSS